MCMHALKKLSLLPTAPADSVGVQRRQSAQGGQRNPLKPWARRNKSSATMKCSHENTTQWIPSLRIHSVWFTLILLNYRCASTLINTERFPPTVSSCLLYVKEKKTRQITGFQSHNELRVVKLLHAEKLILASLALCFDVKEAVMLIVHTDWRLWAPAAIFIHFI